MSFDPVSDYPLGSRRPDLVVTPNGTPLAELTLEALRAGRISADELRATPETLRRQSQVALAAGRPALAANLARAAELAAVPDDVVLEVYTALGRTARRRMSWRAGASGSRPSMARR